MWCSLDQLHRLGSYGHLPGGFSNCGHMWVHQAEALLVLIVQQPSVVKPVRIPPYSSSLKACILLHSHRLLMPTESLIKIPESREPKDSVVIWVTPVTSKEVFDTTISWADCVVPLVTLTDYFHQKPMKILFKKLQKLWDVTSRRSECVNIIQAAKSTKDL